MRERERRITASSLRHYFWMNNDETREKPGGNIPELSHL